MWEPLRSSFGGYRLCRARSATERGRQPIATMPASTTRLALDGPLGEGLRTPRALRCAPFARCRLGPHGITVAPPSSGRRLPAVGGVAYLG